MVLSSLWIPFFQSKGIFHQRSRVETPQHNDMVERKHQHILNMAKSFSFQSNLPLTVWNFSTQHITQIINMLPTFHLKYKIPHEML